MSQQNIAQYIEAALLRPDATEEQVRAFCNEARKQGWYGVCVNPVWIDLAHNVVAGTALRVISVAGFPLGAGLASMKNTDARLSLERGAAEINMVINIGALKGGDTAQVDREIAYVQKSVKSVDSTAKLKVILECPLLTAQEQATAARIAAAHADFLMTGTGFFGATTAEDIAILRQAAPGKPVCAEGPRNAEEARAFLNAGATRLSSANPAGLLG